jgi:hypothetical protein
VEAACGSKHILDGGNTLHVEGREEAADHDVRGSEGIEEDVAGMTACRANLTD